MGQRSAGLRRMRSPWDWLPRRRAHIEPSMTRAAKPVTTLSGSALGIAALGLSLASFMQILDQTIANVSLPTIAGSLGVSPNQGTWVVTSFGVATAIALPLTGWLAQRIGQVRLLLWSTSLFVLA